MSQQNSQQADLTEDYNKKGLPQAKDYDPGALETAQFQAGEPEQQWPEFGLELVPVEYRSKTAGRPSGDGWVDTGRRMILRNGEHISDVSDGYKLLPNEQLVGAANNVARDMGAGPFHEFDGDWFVRLDDHVFQNEDRTRVHALYAWDTGEIGGDSMEYGFAVHNSIDGSLGFSVALFSFRHACKNMVFMGTGSYLEQQALSVEDEREVLSRHSQQHTASLDVDEEALQATVKGTITLIDDADATYEEWVSQEIEPGQIRNLIQRPQLADRDLPNWVADTEDELDEDENDLLTVIETVHEREYGEDEPMPWDHQEELIETRMPDESVWKLYNDITEQIWHSGSSGDQTRRQKMKALHAVCPPAEHGESELTLR